MIPEYFASVNTLISSQLIIIIGHKVTEGRKD